MLEQGRYSWRHDSILNELYNFWKPLLNENEEMFCDLPGNHVGISTLPTSVLITSLRPDLVIVNESEKDITILELTVPFGSNIENANSRTLDKYDQLKNDLLSEGYT